MDSLDNFKNYPDPDEVSPWENVLYYSGIGGLVFIIYGFLGNTLGFGRPSAGLLSMAVFGFFALVIYLFLIFVVIRNFRDKELGGYITLKNAVIVGTATAVLAGVISAIYSYVYVAFIEPDMVMQMAAEMEEMLEELGLDEDAIYDQIEDFKGRMEPSSQFTTGILGSLGMGAVTSLIMGAILKNPPPEDAL